MLTKAKAKENIVTSCRLEKQQVYRCGNMHAL